MCKKIIYYIHSLLVVVDLLKFSYPVSQKAFFASLYLDHQVMTCAICSTEPPVMIIYPKEDVHLDRHVPEEIVLSCELSRSNGKVTWFKDGQKIQESENLTFKREGPYRRLKIFHSRVEDSGEYVCDTADDSKFFHLNITGMKNVQDEVI